MTHQYSIALALADTMLAREATLAGLVTSAAWAFGEEHPWVPEMCEFILERTGENFHYFSRDELAGIIAATDQFFGAFDSFEDDLEPPRIRRYCLDLPLRPEPQEWLRALQLPQIATLADLAKLLNVETEDLGWFADEWRHGSAESKRLQHYHYNWVAKRSGGWRLIEIPKQRLRHMQQIVLRKILDHVPCHDAAHGFRRGRSCVTHASLHAGRRVVMRLDLKDFFPSIPASRIHALFVKLGYSESVAGTLARLCTSCTPPSAFSDRRTGGSLEWTERHALRSPHLPQGSASSPALANLCTWRLDVRLEALAASMGAVYSRYADDLVVSGGGELERAMDRFHVQVAAIALEEGFRVNTRKTRMMRQGVRQQVTGVVINQHTNIRRADFDALKATLTNCIRSGPQSQNREGRADYRQYLAGKVAWVAMLNPARGARLQALMAAIDWSGTGSAILESSILENQERRKWAAISPL